uniref:Uncharacterized protein n=1 Tax=Arundo donax TaxID=35708 RepID=A0A0A8Y353_ARUDO
MCHSLKETCAVPIALHQMHRVGKEMIDDLKF